ncbi:MULTISPECIES: hypothetical protein [Burkholderia]|uniref:hypothetical protein n=1 Tax=Burkholderia TaxID=32008 RepID=UPI0015814262|nr:MULTISPECIES: hypothetical protein [Burkholderia]
MTHTGYRLAAEGNANAMAVTDSVPLLAWCVRSARHCRCPTRANQCRRHPAFQAANV